jgi:hypothetical protein
MSDALSRNPSKEFQSILAMGYKTQNGAQLGDSFMA